MNRPIVHAVLLIVIATVCAVTANAFASRDKKLVLPGYYPNALRVPKRVQPAPQPVAMPAAAPVTEQSPAPGQPPIDVPTATIERPAGTSDPQPSAVSTPAATAPAAAPPVAPQPPVAAAPAELPPIRRFPPHPDKPYVEISGEDVAWLHARGALFLDARRTSIYQEGHIAGARPFSVWESDVDDKVMKLFEERPEPEQQNQPIVIYCSGGACEDSHMLAEKLWGIQFNNIYVYKDGYPDWVKRGGAVRKGATP